MKAGTIQISFNIFDTIIKSIFLEGDKNEKIGYGFSCLVLLFLIASCSTTGYVQTTQISKSELQNRKYLGEVITEKKVWHWFFATGNTEVVAYNEALKSAYEHYGNNIYIANVRYNGSWNAASLLMYWDIFGWVEGIEIRADVYSADIIPTDNAVIDDAKTNPSFSTITIPEDNIEPILQEEKATQTTYNTEATTRTIKTTKKDRFLNLMLAADRTINDFNWDSSDRTDSVGNPAKADNITQTALGKFSNSATLDSDMVALLRISKDSVEFGLFEYLQYIVDGNKDDIVLIQYNDNGTTKSTSGKWQGVTIKVKDDEEFLATILRNQEVNICISTISKYGNIPSIYNFTIKSEGLAAAYLKVFYPEI